MCQSKDDLSSQSYPTLSIDWDAYLPFFEDEDISEEEKRELIEILWSITLSFVDLGFGLNPVQQICGQEDKDLARTVADMVHSKQSNKTQEPDAASSFDDVAGEESA